MLLPVYWCVCSYPYFGYLVTAATCIFYFGDSAATCILVTMLLPVFWYIGDYCYLYFGILVTAATCILAY